MKKHYDFSKAVKSQYADRLKQKNHTITITVENVPARVLKSIKKTTSK